MNILIERRENMKVAGMNLIWSDWFNGGDLRRLTEHPLLRALDQGKAGLFTLKTLLVQHHHYSRHFTRYLTALISKLGNVDDIHNLTENLLEEMGIDGDDKVTHAELYQRTLRALNVQANSQPPFAQTQAMVHAMMSYCRSDDPLDGLAALCLGAEAIVPIVYRPILNALTTFGYAEEDNEFFRLHIEEDEDHAMTMLAIMYRLTKDNPAARTRAIEIGIDMINKRADMLDAVWEHSAQGTASSHQEKEAADETPSAPQRYSSSDFWRVPPKLQAIIPDRLHHKNVILDQTSGAQDFSSERKHKVHIVDLPSSTISMTIGRLQPGEQTRLHRHNYETVIYITAGKGFSRIGNRIVEWAAGDAVYIPVWSAHQHVSTDDDECVYVACENAPLLQNIGGIALREELSAAGA